MAAGDADNDLVREAAAELYSGDPAGFIHRRGDLAARARASGDAAAAKAIRGLRKPTRSAWAVNRLMREDPDVPARLSALGAGLRAAEGALDGRKLRQLSQDRRELIAALTRQALAAAGARDAPAAFQEEVAATLSAAVADPQVAAELREGSLVRPVQRSGFGFGVPAGDERPDPAGNGDVPPGAVRPQRSAAGRRHPGPGPAKQERAERQWAERERAERAERERAERERAEQERQRQAVAAAEKAVRAADQGVSAARAAEEERADAVLRMERQLQDAQDRLAEAKRRSRAAVAGLRDARRALDRLRKRAGPGRPPDRPTA
jgi:hypothetical protein